VLFSCAVQLDTDAVTDMEMANVTGRVCHGSDRRVADQEYRRRRRSDAAVRSAKNANMKRRQESRQRSADEYYEAASHDRSL